MIFNTMLRKTLRPHHLLVKFANKYCTGGSNKTILDVGCGSGVNTKYMVDTFNYQYDGFDPVPENIEFGKTNFNLSNLQIGDAKTWKYENEKYDHVLYINVCMYFANNDQCEIIRKLSKTIKSKGYLFYSVFLNWHEEDEQMDLQEVNIFFNKRGFKMIENEYYDQGPKHFLFIVYQKE